MRLKGLLKPNASQGARSVLRGLGVSNNPWLPDYHRTLRCFVLIDLKIGKLTSADVGQMLSYVGYYQVHELREGENPAVGLILCTDADRTIARYALLERDQQVFAARYQLYLPSEKELQEELERERDTLLREAQLEKLWTKDKS